VTQHPEEREEWGSGRKGGGRWKLTCLGALGVPVDLNRKIGREGGDDAAPFALRGRDEDSGFD